MKVSIEILDAIHDLVVDIEDRCPSSAEQVKLYEALPEEIKMLFEEWGGHDTVARNMTHEFLHNKFEAIKNKPNNQQ